jgi:CHAD domain-containing protein
MKRYSISPKEFVRKFGKNVGRVSKRVREYVDEQSEDNIHDARTAIRRLESSFRLLPKKLRKKQRIRNYVIQCKELFRINSEIRNYDIIHGKLLKYSDTPAYEELTRSLKRKRNSELRKARRIALAITKSKIPTIGDISGKKLQAKFDKIVERLNARIEKRIPVVISDVKKVEELHEMRKDYKKLRYTLELSSDKTSKIVQRLQELQDILGSIHDNDIMIEYLKGIEPEKVRNILNDEIADRLQKYNKLVELFKGSETTHEISTSTMLN